MTSALKPPVEAFVRGFEDAYERLVSALGDINTPPADAFLPLFETLSWAVVLGGVGRSARASGVQRGVIKELWPDLLALELARNRSHHQWLSALQVADILNPVGGFKRYTTARGARVHESRPVSIQAWVWAKLADLPGGRSKKGAEEAYVERLEGQQARIVLDRVSAALRDLR